MITAAHFIVFNVYKACVLMFFRKVLNRAVESMKYLMKQAENSPNRCVGAVSHSTFIRILVGVLLDEPLVKAATRKIDNCSITVLDFPKGFKSRRLGPKDKLLGGLLSLAPPDFMLDVPICTIVRTNENRHLPEIPLGELLSRRAENGSSIRARELQPKGI